MIEVNSGYLVCCHLAALSFTLARMPCAMRSHTLTIRGPAEHMSLSGLKIGVSSAASPHLPNTLVGALRGWEAIHPPWHFRHPLAGAGDRREGQLQTVEVAPGTVERLTIFLDRAKQFSHGAMESFSKPCSLQRR